MIAPLRRRSDPLVLLLDLASGLSVALLAYRLRFEGQLPLPPIYEHRYLVAGSLTAVAWASATRFVGLGSRRALRPGTSNTEASVTAAFVVGLSLLFSSAVFVQNEISRAWIGLETLGLLVAGIVTRGLLRRGRRVLAPLGVGLERYALIGEDADARRLADDLTRAPGAPFRVVQSLPGHLTPAELAERARRDRLDGLILPASGPLAADLAHALSGTGIDVLVAPGFEGLEQRVASVAVLHGVPLLRMAGLVPRRRAQRGRSGVRDLSHGVAILGIRGIPGTYGGFETFAERLALHLVEHQIETTVYCRTAYATEASPWRGVRLVTLPTVRNKYLDTVVHTVVSAGHLILTRGPRDVVMCNAANAPVLVLLRLFRRRVIMNVDGLEWRRGKWGVAGRAWFRMGEWLSVRLASVLVTDADEVRTYYRVRHDTDSVMIPYGADLLERGSGELPLPVDRDGYFLYVSRWEIENNPVMTAEGHRDSGVGAPLIMLGQATYDDRIEAQVHAVAGDKTLTPGGLYGPDYRSLQASALAYIHATEVGGTHPALIEAMGAGNICLVMDTPENREVAGPAGALFFSNAETLAARISDIAGMPPAQLTALRSRARDHAARNYSWSAVGASYLGLLRGHEESRH